MIIPVEVEFPVQNLRLSTWQYRGRRVHVRLVVRADVDDEVNISVKDRQILRNMGTTAHV